LGEPAGSAGDPASSSAMAIELVANNAKMARTTTVFPLRKVIAELATDCVAFPIVNVIVRPCETQR
jgi:hypothetical protein